ncbi:hypothetical protein G5V58_01420 [Nocardioides anomalus]|uniref:histidine kinase n=1 Tax=Nocardioides anomalus TaxID=2712223 RepID=A0A6G6W8E4_9ACTN|nr:histidine kinase [Nocardioides anomalus]QIG41608.1 hypothetical protein G5V58_01420 [Nocardioides anomalus]
MLDVVRPARTPVVWALPAVGLAALGVTLVAQLWSRGAEPQLSPDPPVVFGVTSLVQCLVARAVLRRHTVPRLGVFIAVTGCLWALAGVLHAVVASPPFVAGLADGVQTPEKVVLWGIDLTTLPLSSLVYVVLLSFPTGYWLEGAWRRVTQVGIALIAGVGVVLVFLRLPLSVSANPSLATPESTALDPTYLPGFAPALDPHADLIIAIAYVGAVLCGATVVVRYRRSSGVERDQLRWVVWGIVSVVFIVLAFRLLIHRGDQLSTVGICLAVNAIAVSVGVALINPSLVSIEELLSRTLVYGGLSLGIILVDLAALAALTELLGSRLGQRQVVLVVLLLSAVLYSPMRAWLWASVRRWVLGQRDDPYDVVARLASSLEAADEETEQLTAVAQAVALAFGIGYVSVRVDRADGAPLVATYGTPVADTRVLPISYRGERVGVLVLPARGVRARLSKRDERLLTDLVRQAATASRTGRLAEELQENRQRLVVAREEERRRIHHDLAEDLGPTLGGLVHQVESARLLVAERPEEAKATIARTSEQLRAVVADVRRVVHDLRPPALDDLGLLGALRQQAKLLDAETLTVTARGAELERLPAGVEVAAYRIASELLGHCASTAAGCELVLSLSETRLLIEADVADAPGEFLDLVRHQAVEVGGRLDRTPDGRLRVALPVRRAS